MGGGVQVGTASLPPVVRDEVVALSARALGELAATDVPRSLTSVARFTPVKRARVGSTAIARALDGDPAFRAAVAARVAAGVVATAQSGGRAPDDPIGAAARAFLLGLPDAGELINAAAQVSESDVLRARSAELARAVEELTAEVSALREGAADGGPSAPPTGDARRSSDGGEADRLRARLRERGQRVREAELAVSAAQQATVKVREQLAAAELVINRERSTAAQWKQKAEQADLRAEQAKAALDRVRDQLSGERAAADRRVELLLDALQGAAAGLRAQWKVATGGADPADLVAARLAFVPRAAERTVDPTLLTDWLTLPGAHLIVDGYNVTKTGYGGMTLADQRMRLTKSLGALAARTSAEVTVVFDGAAVTATPAAVRGVRVLFSPPGVIADQVVRELAAAEPAGRVVVVVSSDKEVVDGVRRSGARTAPSVVLLTVLGS